MPNPVYFETSSFTSTSKEKFVKYVFFKYHLFNSMNVVRDVLGNFSFRIQEGRETRFVISTPSGSDLNDFLFTCTGILQIEIHKAGRRHTVGKSELLFDIRAFKRNGSTVCEMNYIHQVSNIICCVFLRINSAYNKILPLVMYFSIGKGCRNNETSSIRQFKWDEIFLT